jgi:ubiquinone/menaquinone biosynthesis C-methylase UbiE
MLTKLLPPFVKRTIEDHVRRIADATGWKPYFQSHANLNDYCIKPKENSAAPHVNIGLPVPPEELMKGYGPAEPYLTSGKQHVANLVRILEESGFSIRRAKRILEFGCAAGRMIRHLPDVAQRAELWGVDVSAEHIRWCIENLTPTIHFATTTLIPHLPFEDRFFDLIFCGSLFTHIEDLQETWLLELGRVLCSSGKLYLTIHDEHTVRLLDTKHKEHLLSKALHAEPIYTANKAKFDMIVVGRGPNSQVFYSSACFRSTCPPIFRWISLTHEAYGYQSAVLLERLPID